MASVATRNENPIVALNNQLAARADQFKMVLPAHISPEKFQRTILTAAQSDPALLDADRQSFMMACMKCAQDGLLPDKREAALVIFKENKQVSGQWQTRLLVQYMPMVYGLRKKILQSGEIADIQTSVVYKQEIEGGYFVYEEGSERMLRHKPILDPDFDPSDDDLALAYSFATFKDGTQSFEVMRRGEIQKIQEKSQTGATRDKKGQPRTPSGPWVEWKSEQWRKTVLRRHSKSLPMSGDLLDVEAHDDELAARSTQAVLSAPTAAAPAMPSRIAAAAHDGDGVILDMPVRETVDVEATAEKPKAQTRKAKPESAGDAQTESVDEMDNKEVLLIDRINKAMDPATAKRIFDETPDNFEPERRERVRVAFAARDKDLRAGAE